jgi:phosphate transport system protein
MRSKFDQDLSKLHDMMIEMGAMIEKSISLANIALVEQDTEAAKKAIELDNGIDQQEKDIESLCLRLLLQQQPVARDLRVISAALKMITDMERIGDQAADIAEITLYLAETTQHQKPQILPAMAAATSKMVTESIDAYVKRDLKLAHDVIEYDDVVDSLFDEAREMIVALIRSDSAAGQRAIDLVMIAKYFERIGDHATNIAEWVVFSITGKHYKSIDS